MGAFCNPESKFPRLRALNSNPIGEVTIVQWQSLAEESSGIADFCNHLVKLRGYHAHDILVLSPRRIIGYAIRDAMQRRGIATHSFYYEEALEQMKAQKSLALLSLLNNKEDRVSLRFWLGLESPTWNAREYAVLRNYCSDLGLSPFVVLSDLEKGNLHLTNTNTLVERFRSLLAELDANSHLVGHALLNRLFPDGCDWSQGVRDAALLKLHEQTSATDLLNILRTQIAQPEMPEESVCARVMSLHKSKGLTAKVVIVAGCIEGLMPIHDSDLSPVEQNELLMEQRPLFYVALTRCTDMLVLSSVLSLNRRTAFRMGAKVQGRGNTSLAITSRFIHELGPTAPRSKKGTAWVAGGFL